MGRNRTEKTELTPTQRKFLANYSIHGTITKAAQMTRIRRENHQVWKQDELYRQRFEAARARFRDQLKNAAIKRGVEGYAEPVFYKGRMVGVKQRYSDQLLLAVLQAMVPEFQKRMEVQHTGTVSHAHIDLTKLSLAESQELIAMMDQPAIPVESTAKISSDASRAAVAELLDEDDA